MHPLLENRSFLSLLSGRLVTNAGDSLYYVAAIWLVYDLTGSSFYTGLAGALVATPQALQFLVGPFVDRWPLGRLLVRTQLVQGALVLVVPLAAWTGHLSVWLVLIVMPLLSALNQFVYPAQSAALPRLVEDEHLVEANSLFSFAYQGTQTVFNGIGGLLVAAIGAIAVFALDAVTFAVAAALFACTRIPPVDDPAPRIDSPVREYVRNLAEGIVYVRGSILVPILGASVVANFAVGATIAALPAFADARGGPEAYGLLLAGITAGTLVGALCATPLKGVSLGTLSGVGYLLGGLFWLLAVGSPTLFSTVALFALAWVPIGITNVVFAALIQTVVPEYLLGRLTSLNMSISVAANPIGALLGGAGGDLIGPTPVVAAVGVSLLGLAAFWLLHPGLRTIPTVAGFDPGRYGLGSPDEQPPGDDERHHPRHHD
jgi:hypothetical protein